MVQERILRIVTRELGGCLPGEEWRQADGYDDRVFVSSAKRFLRRPMRAGSWIVPNARTVWITDKQYSLSIIWRETFPELYALTKIEGKKGILRCHVCAELDYSISKKRRFVCKGCRYDFGRQVHFWHVTGEGRAPAQIADDVDVDVRQLARWRRWYEKEAQVPAGPRQIIRHINGL